MAVPLLIAADEPKRIKLTPLGNPAFWVTPGDYPKEALRSRRVGTVSFRLDVDEAGDVAECTVTGSSGTAILDETACELLSKRGKFVPPQDEHGKPARSYYLNRVVWRIPNAEPFEPSSTLVEFDVDTDGNVTNCRATDQLNAKNIPLLCDMATIDMRTRVKPSRPTHVRVVGITEVTTPAPQ